MFTIGILSIIFAAGIKPVIVLLVSNTTIGVGAAPKLHCKRAVEQTCMGIDYFPLKYKMLYGEDMADLFISVQKQSTTRHISLQFTFVSNITRCYNYKRLPVGYHELRLQLYLRQQTQITMDIYYFIIPIQKKPKKKISPRV